MKPYLLLTFISITLPLLAQKTEVNTFADSKITIQYPKNWKVFSPLTTKEKENILTIAPKKEITSALLFFKNATPEDRNRARRMAQNMGIDPNAKVSFTAFNIEKHSNQTDILAYYQQKINERKAIFHDKIVQEPIPQLINPEYAIQNLKRELKLPDNTVRSQINVKKVYRVIGGDLYIFSATVEEKKTNKYYDDFEMIWQSLKINP